MMLDIKLTKSAIGYSKRQGRTAKALGLTKIGQTVSHRDTPAIRGMVRVVKHLIEVKERPETVEETAARKARLEIRAAAAAPEPVAVRPAKAAKVAKAAKPAAGGKGEAAGAVKKTAPAKVTKKDEKKPAKEKAKAEPKAKALLKEEPAKAASKKAAAKTKTETEPKATKATKAEKK